MDDEPEAGAIADIEMRRLIGELDRPLLPGFMTAGYSALGRYIFLAAQAHRSRSSPTRTA